MIYIYIYTRIIISQEKILRTKPKKQRIFFFLLNIFFIKYDYDKGGKKLRNNMMKLPLFSSEMIHHIIDCHTINQCPSSC